MSSPLLTKITKHARLSAHLHQKPLSIAIIIIATGIKLVCLRISALTACHRLGSPLISQLEPDITLFILAPHVLKRQTIHHCKSLENIEFSARTGFSLQGHQYVLICSYLFIPSSVATSNDSILTPTENLDNPLGATCARRDSQGVLQSPGIQN